MKAYKCDRCGEFFEEYHYQSSTCGRSLDLCPTCNVKLHKWYTNDTERVENEEMSNLEKAKEIIKTYYEDADCGIFNSRNTVGDTMETIYEDEGLTIDICYYWSYFEVFGLSRAEFEELEEYYDSLKPESEG